MPKIKSSPKATTPTQQPPPLQPDLASLGIAIALADLAEAKGMTIEGVSSLPHVLTAAGLPDKIAPTIGRTAHRIYRDRIDAMLYRCNRPLNQPAPILDRPQAEAAVVKAEQSVVAAKTAERVKAAEQATPKKDRPVAAPVVAEADPIEF